VYNVSMQLDRFVTGVIILLTRNVLS